MRDKIALKIRDSIKGRINKDSVSLLHLLFIVKKYSTPLADTDHKTLIKHWNQPNSLSRAYLAKVDTAYQMHRIKYNIIRGK